MGKKDCLVNQYNPLIVIPTYNHAGTIPCLVREIQKYFQNILIVNDGSTDNLEQKIKDLKTAYIKHEKNIGKGAAILSAAAYAKQNNYSHILTIDADGQHYPKELVNISSTAKEFDRDIIIGKRNFEGPNVPSSSKFGRKFSAFWARVQTGVKIEDIQSGMRAYPLEIFDCLKLKEKRYSFEMEIIIKAIWAGFNVREIPIEVLYPKREERVSHFKAFKDNLLITILNTKLTIRALLPIPHRKYRYNEKQELVSINPFKVVKDQLKANESPKILAVSAVWSVFWGSLALPGIRTMCLLVGIGYFNLNRPVALTMDKLAMPPFIPAICIEVGYFMLHGRFLTEFTLRTLGYQIHLRIFEWILGSLLVAPVFALLVGLIVFIIGKIIRKGLLISER